VERVQAEEALLGLRGRAVSDQHIATRATGDGDRGRRGSRIQRRRAPDHLRGGRPENPVLLTHLRRHPVAALRHIQQRRINSHRYPLSSAYKPALTTRTNTARATGPAASSPHLPHFLIHPTS